MRLRRPRVRVVLAAALLAAAPLAAQSAPGRIEGEVVDSLGVPAPFASAEVWVVGTALRASTDARGRFRLDSVPAGTHDVTFFHPVLDSLGLTAPTATIAVRGGQRTRVRLATPSGHALFARSCGRAPEPHEGAVFGAVREAERDAPAAAQVAVVWLEYTKADGARRDQPAELMRRIARTTSDASGRFVVCGVPNQLGLEAQATTTDAASGVLSLQLGRRFVTTMQIHVGAASASTARSASLAGRVVSPEGTPVADALVSAADDSLETRTDSLGRFRLDGLPAGSQTVVARAIGFAPVERVVVLRRDRAADETLTLSRTATTLPSVRITDRGPRTRAYLGFAERQRRGWGTFVDSMAVARLRPHGVANMLRTSPAILVVGVSRPPEQRVFILRHGQRCEPDIWIDGIFQRAAEGGVDRMIAPDNVVAIEIYRGLEVPPLFQRASTRIGEDPMPCGAVVIWSRVYDGARAR